MKKLAISFVTYNRPQHIQEYLEYILKPTLEREIDIYIYMMEVQMKQQKRLYIILLTKAIVI